METTVTVFDLDAALAHVDGDVFILKDLATMLVDLYPEMVAKIESSIDRRDADSLYRATHTLEGSLTTFFAQPAITVTKSIQSICQSKQWEDAPEIVEFLKTELDRLASKLKSMAETSPDK